MVKYIIEDGYGYNTEVLSIVTPSSIDELIRVITRVKEAGLRLKVLGNRTNVLFVRRNLNLVVLRLNRGIFKSIKNKGGVLEVGSGVNIKELLNYCLKQGLSGLEFLVGIPGTIGGAVRNNAGAFGREVGDFVSKVMISDYEGNLKVIEKEKIKFAYRDSDFKNVVIIKSYFNLISANVREIKDKLRHFFSQRMLSQNLKLPSSGCFFKNPQGYKVKDIVNTLGLAGRSRGHACISDKHSNFLIARRDTSCEDILSLKDLLQRRIWKERKIWLDPEVEILW